MDALIMAAGRGSRLGDVTADRPKSLVDLGGISPLELQLDALAARSIRTAIVVTGYRADLVRAAVERHSAGRLDIRFVFNPFWSVTNVLGSAWFARDLLTDEFVYLHADTVFDPTILDDLLASTAPIALPVDLRPCEREEMKAEVSDGRILHLSKDLEPARTAGEFIGIGVFRSAGVSAVREAVEREIAAGAIDAYFEAAINRAIESGVWAQPIAVDDRAWTEIDFAEDLELARSLLPRLTGEATR